MDIKTVIELIDAKPLTPNISNEICGVIACDMLSWAMANAKEGYGFVTIQTSLNTVAVASLTDMPCIIIAQNANIEDSVIEKAISENICIISSGLTTYEICGILYSGGLKN